MKIVRQSLRLKMLAGGLAPALLWLFCSAEPLGAQAQAPSAAENQAVPAAEAESSADHTMTIVMYVPGEVYEFEGLKVGVEEYQVKRGDSLSKLLKARGLLSSRSKAEEAKWLVFVKKMNPGLKDPSAIVPGQTLKLPVLLEGAVTATSFDGTPQGSPQTTTPPPPSGTVKVYERPQSTQQSARVRTMVHADAGQPGAQTQPGLTQEASADLKRATAPEDQPSAPSIAAADLAAAGAASPDQAPPASVASGPLLDFPSGNPGTLAMEPESKVVYRTVKVRKGDSLERLLRREGMHRDLIYSHLLKVTLELNPDIKNRDLIMVGAELKIPAAGDYLTTMAGVNPQEVISAAKVISERGRPDGGGAGRQSARAAVLELPDEAVLAAKNTLGLVFTRLGDKVDSRGTVLIPAGEAGVALDTSSFPLVELSGGGRLVLDPGSRLTPAAIRNLRKAQPPYQVFRTGKNETLERALGRLWPLCGYFRVYTKDRAYEGGGDIRLKIAADWMIWTTPEAWNSGQPLVINRAKSPEQGTDPAWTGFLEAHGIKVLDIHRNQLLAAPAAPAAGPDLPVINLPDEHPTLMAAELVKALGVEPRVGVQVDLARQPGETVAANLTAPVLWEDGSTRVVMEFGELPPEAIQTLRQNGYRVISSGKNAEAVVDGVLGGFGLKARDSLVLTAPAGGPKMSLSIKGKFVSRGDHKYLITSTPLPAGLAALVEPNLKIIKY